MAFVASFSAASVSGTPSDILFTDTSTGSDGAITSRRIYAKTDKGTFLVETGTTTDYEVWALPLATSITLDLLTKDYALTLIVELLDVNDVVLYDYTVDAQGFTEYSEEFDYGLTQLMSGNPLLINDNDFWPHKSKLRALINSGNKAITVASDLFNAQLCYDAATDLRLNSQYYFNGNQ